MRIQSQNWQILIAKIELYHIRNLMVMANQDPTICSNAVFLID